MKKEIRNQQIVRLRDEEELTFRKIGEVFNISRQRAYQIYNQNSLPYSGDSTPTLSSKERSEEVNN